MDDWPFLVDKMDSMNSLVDFNLFTKISGQINTGDGLATFWKFWVDNLRCYKCGWIFFQNESAFKFFALSYHTHDMFYHIP